MPRPDLAGADGAEAPKVRAGAVVDGSSVFTAATVRPGADSRAAPSGASARDVGGATGMLERPRIPTATSY